MTARTFFVVPYVLCAVILAVTASPTSAQEKLTAHQIARAREGLMSSLKADPRSDLEQNKFIGSGERIEDARLGEPYAFYRMESECIQELADYRAFKQCLTFFFWCMPVSFGGDARIILQLYSKDGEWQIAGYGGKPAYIENARSRWPKSEGYELSYVMEIGGPAFIMVEQKDNIWLCPLFEWYEEFLGVKKDSAGHYPLLDIPYVVERLHAREDVWTSPRSVDTSLGHN